MKLIHFFNSSVVSGPENLIVNNLVAAGWDWELWNLEELRLRGKQEKLGRSLKDLCEEKKVRYRAFPVRGRWDIGALKFLKKELFSLGPALVHAHDVKASTYLVAAAPRVIKILSTHHGIWGRPDLRTSLYEKFYRFFVLPRFEKIFAVSKADEEVLKKKFSSKVMLLRNAIPISDELSLKLHRQQRSQIRSDWKKSLALKSWPEDLPLLGFVGRLSPEKDPLFALEIAQRSQIRLIFFGEGALRPVLEREIRNRGLSERVFCFGYHSQMATQYVALDLLLSTSKAEGMPLNLLESSASGVPFLARNVGGIGEIIGSEKDLEDLLLPAESPVESFCDRLKQLFESPGQLENLAVLLRSQVQKNFSFEKWAQELSGVYQNLGWMPSRGLS